MLLVLFSLSAFSQSKKEIKKYKLKSTTVTVTDATSSKTQKESFEKYDGNGNVIEEEEYSKEGAYVKSLFFLLQRLGVLELVRDGEKRTQF